MSSVSTLRPGYLVALKTSVRGNVKYFKSNTEIVQDGGAIISRWDTERRVSDAEEHAKAVKVRSACRTAIRSVCSESAFGMLCPSNSKSDLDAAYAEAQRLVTEFNKSASLTRVDVYLMVGEIAADDVQAVKAINSEVADLLRRMETGVRTLDPDSIRAAANQAKQLGQMLSAQSQERLQEAVDAVRKTARAIVKAGETAAVEVDEAAIKALVTARMSFLDMDEAAEVQSPDVANRAIEFETGAFAAPAPLADVALVTPAFEIGE